MCLAQIILLVLLMFDSGVGMLFSRKPDDTNIKFNLYINDNINNSYEINMKNIPDAPINTDCPIEVIIHGWIEYSNASWIISMKNQLLESGCNNVIAVDWSNFAFYIYPKSVYYVPSIGEYIGRVLISLADMKKLNMESIHIRGFSLGAHVTGFTGKTIIKQTHTKIGRITGFDPAGPLFESVSADKRLDKNDAMFTDIIHTDGAKNGLPKEIGHADFYPNGGCTQPCSNSSFETTECSHARSHDYFIESIQSNAFVSTSCNSFSNFLSGKCNDREKFSMGYHLNTEVAKGKYYLLTNASPPYAQGEK